MANVFFFATRLTDTSAFINTFVSLPFEDGKRSEADTAFLPKIFLEHADIGVLAITSITCDRKVR